MEFSVIVPVYNVLDYLEECVKSILGQVFEDYEVILVDDGSTDGSGQLCDDLQKLDKRISVIHQDNSGSANARNAGTKIAKGDFIIYIDSDDYFVDEFVFSKLEKKCKNNMDVVLYGYKKYYESSKTFGQAFDSYPEIQLDDDPSLIITKLLQSNMYEGSAWSKTVRRKLLQENEIQFTPGLISEDSDWYLNVVMHAKHYAAIKEPFIAYRQREGSISKAPKEKSLTDNIFILNKWIQIVEESELTREMKNALRSVLARYYGNDLILYASLPKEISNKHFSEMKSLKYLLRYSMTKRAKIISAAVNTVGLKFVIKMLRFAKRMKRNI